ncbi:MAG: hypothetical protein AAF719_11750 [Pseudomonadota bacterium]
MSGADRIRVGLTALLAMLISTLGLQPAFSDWVWPIAGLWAAAAWSSLGLSLWAAGVLCVMGLFQDIAYEAPLGAWPLAFLGAYSVGLVTMARTPPMSRLTAEAITVFGGLVAAAVALAAANDLAGAAAFWRNGMIGDLLITAALYPLARNLFPHAEVLEARR